MTHFKYTGILLAVAIGLSLGTNVFAQGDPINWLPAGVGDWNVGANWEDVGFGNNVPESKFDEVAVINTGGTAQVTSDLSSKPIGGITITDGTVEVTSSGTLVAEANPPPPGDPVVTGFANVGADGVLQVAGTLSLAGNLGLGGSFVADLASSSYTPIDVKGTANLGGALVANFVGAPATPGSSWNLIDATTVTGGFDLLTAQGATLPLGVGLGIQQVAGGTNGNLVRLSVEQQLVFNFNRETKVGSIQNLSSSPVSFAIDGYWLKSAIGSLDPAGWDSLQNQGTGGSTWFETGTDGTMNQLAELNPTTSTTLAPGQSLELGPIYSQNFADLELGADAEDHEFEYRTDTGQNVQAAVTYTGDKQYNNVVLTVDPTTGNASMQNESEISVDLDLFTIASPSGGLLTGYNSLQDQGASGGNWLTANLSDTRISELMSQDVTTLETNEGFYIDGLYNIAGAAQDLTFHFLMPDENALFDGVVVFGDLPDNVIDPDQPAGLPGDYNGNGAVEQADLDLVLLNWGKDWPPPVPGWDNDQPTDGKIDQNDLDGVLLNWGNMAAAAAAVPEPSSWMLMAAGVIALATRRRC